MQWGMDLKIDLEIFKNPASDSCLKLCPRPAHEVVKEKCVPSSLPLESLWQKSYRKAVLI